MSSSASVRICASFGDLSSLAEQHYTRYDELKKEAQQKADTITRDVHEREKLVEAYNQVAERTLNSTLARAIVFPDFDKNTHHFRACFNSALVVAGHTLLKLAAEHMMNVPSKSDKVVVITGGIASGKSTKLPIIRKSYTVRPHAMWDITGQSLSMLQTAVRLARKHGKLVDVIWVKRPFEEAVEASVERAFTSGHNMNAGKTLSPERVAMSHLQAPKNLKIVQDEFRNDPGVVFKLLENRSHQKTRSHIVPLGDHLERELTGSVRTIRKKYRQRLKDAHTITHATLERHRGKQLYQIIKTGVLIASAHDRDTLKKTEGQELLGREALS